MSWGVYRGSSLIVCYTRRQRLHHPNGSAGENQLSLNVDLASSRLTANERNHETKIDRVEIIDFARNLYEEGNVCESRTLKGLGGSRNNTPPPAISGIAGLGQIAVGPHSSNRRGK